MRYAYFALSLFLIVSGCTSAPRIVQASGPSLDNGVPNSGVLSILPDGKSYMVTPLFNERYGALVKLYGWKLVPPMTAPRWITPFGQDFVLTGNGMAAFAELNFYERQHFKP